MVEENVWWWKEYPDRDKEWVCHYPPDIAPLSYREFEQDLWQPRQDRLGIYIQIPFCEAICVSCDYNKFRVTDLGAYEESLHREIDLYGEKGEIGRVPISYIYFGGGTPSVLSPQQYERLLSHLNSTFSLVKGVEISVEAHPSTIDLAKVQGFYEAGINRLSIGVQSFHDESLEAIGRGHTSMHCREAIENAKIAGFGNVNADLMFGLPGQTIATWKSDLEELVRAELDHISCYEYMIDPYGSLALAAQQGIVPALPTEDTKVEMTLAAFELLDKAGYRHYKSQSSCGFDFARPEKACRYEVMHMCAPQAEYLAMGAGARGFFNGYVYFTIHTIQEYMSELSKGNLPILAGKRLTLADRMSMFCVLGIKCLTLDKEAFYRQFSTRIEDVFGSPLQRLIEQGLVEQDERFIYVTRKGRLYGDNISKAFYNQANYRVPQPSTTELQRLSRELFGSNA